MMRRLRTTRAFTFVEAIVVLALLALLGAVFYPVLTRAVRSTFQVTTRASIQSGLRYAVESLVRDVHQAHVILERGDDPPHVSLFRPGTDVTEAPENSVETNRTGDLPQFPFSGETDGSALAGEPRMLMDGEKVVYRLEIPSGQSSGRLSRSAEKGRLVGRVAPDPATGRSGITEYSFQNTGEATVKELATEVTEFHVIPVVYREDGFPSRAPDPPTSAALVAIVIEASAEPVKERDEPAVTPGTPTQRVVTERIVTKAWLQRRVSELTHPGAAAAFDETLDF